MISQRMQAWFGYLRGMWLRARGAKLGAKCRIDRMVYLEHASGLCAGDRIHLEQNVAIKIVRSGAWVVLGNGVFLGRNTTLDISEGLEIGDRTLIAPGCFVTDHNHGIAAGERIVDQGCAGEPIFIGADAWVGANACILPGVRIGNGAIIGAGAVVNHDIPDGSLAVGVPARIIGHRGGKP